MLAFHHDGAPIVAAAAAPRSAVNLEYAQFCVVFELFCTAVPQVTAAASRFGTKSLPVAVWRSAHLEPKLSIDAILRQYDVALRSPMGSRMPFQPTLGLLAACNIGPTTFRRTADD
jgi:hypothetical protein